MRHLPTTKLSEVHHVFISKINALPRSRSDLSIFFVDIVPTLPVIMQNYTNTVEFFFFLVIQIHGKNDLKNQLPKVVISSI